MAERERPCHCLCSLFVVRTAWRTFRQEGGQCSEPFAGFSLKLPEHDGMKDETQPTWFCREGEFVDRERALRVVLMPDRGGKMGQERWMVDHLDRSEFSWFEGDIACFDADEPEPWFADAKRRGTKSRCRAPTREPCFAKQCVPFQPPRVIVQQLEHHCRRNGHLLLNGC